MISDFKNKSYFIVHEGFLFLNAKTEINHTEHITVSVNVTIKFYRVDENGEPIIDDNYNKINTSSERDTHRTDVENAGAIANSFFPLRIILIKRFSNYLNSTMMNLMKLVELQVKVESLMSTKDQRNDVVCVLSL